VQARRLKSAQNKVDMGPRLWGNRQDADLQLCSKLLSPKTTMSNHYKLLVEEGENEPNPENKQPNLLSLRGTGAEAVQQ
jgi:hypothetical protein